MISNLTIGIASGLIAAFMQSCSYLCGRRFLLVHGDARQLLFASMIIEGMAALILAPFLINWEKLLSWQMLWYVFICNTGYIVGSWGFFSAQKHIESSRIASLMGLKVIMVMLLSMVFLGSRFVYFQYVAIVICALSAMLMNWSRGKLDWGGMGFLLVALIGYAVSDLGVQLIVNGVSEGDPIRGGLSGFSSCYGICGIIGLLLMKPCRITWKMIQGAVPQALCWIVSMWGLYICFGLLGASFGNIIQASRGVISLVMGIILSHLAIQGLEAKQSCLVWIRKTVAALLMFGAIVLYALSVKG